MNRKDCILVCCHKDDIKASGSPYLPIHVGKALSGAELGIQGDDVGDNISAKNRSYCELTGMYWAWRNTDSDIIGLCHYRRYFDFHKLTLSFMSEIVVAPSYFVRTDLSAPDERIMRKVSRGMVIAAKPMVMNMTLAEQYDDIHYAKDLDTLRSVIADMGNEAYIKAFDKVMFRNCKLRPYNMFVMCREDYARYCAWLFGVLAEVEKRIDISTYDDYQRRIFGFMAERLLNVYLKAERKKVLELPVIAFLDTPQDRRGLVVRFTRYILKELRGLYGAWRSIRKPITS